MTASSVDIFSGFSISPTPATRQSSDSAFSNHTDSSNLTKQTSSFEEKESTITKTRKRSIDSGDNGSIETSSDYRPSGSKRVEELRRSQKRPKMQSSNTSQADSDYEDNNSASYMPETDSDEPLLNNNFNCKKCPRQFTSRRSLANHVRIHDKKDALVDNIMIEVPQKVEDTADAEEKLSCNKCGKTFKLKIMLNRHFNVCGKTPVKALQKELLVALQPIDGMVNRTIECEICTAKFKTIDNLEKHMKVVHAAVLKREKRENAKVPVPCLYCQKMFADYYEHSLHFYDCPQRDDSLPYECPVCKKITSRKTSYFQHLKNMHFEPRSYHLNNSIEGPESHDCRMCNKKLPSQDLLIKHLAAHMSNIEDNDIGADNESRYVFFLHYVLC